MVDHLLSELLIVICRKPQLKYLGFIYVRHLVEVFELIHVRTIMS